MSRFMMTLAAAAASAVAAIALVALPALGAGSRTPRQQAQAPDVSAFAACLRSHGLADAPTEPEQLKPWLGAQGASRPDTVKAAMLACDDKLPDKPTVVDRKPAGPDMEKMIACVRAHGLDAPTAPDAFKRWVADKETSDPGAVDTAIRACKMSLDPGPSEGPAKPGACINDVRPADKPAPDKPAAGKPAPDTAAPDTAANSGT
jgi:hypothetical protein